MLPSKTHNGTSYSASRSISWIGPFFALNLLVFLACSFLYARAGNLILTPLAGGFFAAMAIGHMLALGGLVLLPTLCTSLLIKNRVIVSVIASFSVSALLGFFFLDIKVFELYRFHINAAIVEMIFSDAAKDIFVFSWETYRKVFGLATLVVGSEFALASYLIRKNHRLPGRTWLWTLSFLLLVGLHHGLYALSDALSYVPITRQAGLLPAYFPTTLKSLGKILGKPMHLETSDTIGMSDLSYPLHPMRCAGPEKQTNLLIIAIDSWRHDMLDESITPHISAFAQNAEIFENHSSGGSATRTGIFSLFYGLTANYWHAFFQERRGPILIDLLRQFDYEMGIFGSAPLTSPEFDRTVFADISNLRLRSPGEAPYQKDESISEEFIKFLKTRDTKKPFFGFLFYDAPHAFSLPKSAPKPFQPTLDEPDFLALNAEYDPVPFRNLYKNTLLFDDALIGKVFEALKNQGLLENTIVLITGDHGQEFNENGKNYWGHSGNFTRYQIGVPFVLSWPGHNPKKYFGETNHIDFVPTLGEELFRCSNLPDDYSLGKNIFHAPEKRTFLLGNYGEQAIIHGDKTTLIHPYGGIEEVDAQLNPTKEQFHDPQVVQEFLRQQSMFFLAD